MVSTVPQTTLTEIRGIVIVWTRQIHVLEERDQLIDCPLVHAATVGHNVQMVEHLQQSRTWLVHCGDHNPTTLRHLT